MANIIIIDDNEDLNSIIAEHLQIQGFVVHSAYNGRDGFDIVQKEPIDLIILDIEMPVMNGLQFLKKIKKIAHLSFIPILMYSSINHENYQVETLKFGADDFISKPVSLDLLQAKVEALLRRSQQNTETKRSQFKLLYQILSKYTRKKYNAFTYLLPNYADAPDGWHGNVPDLILTNKNDTRCYFFESYQALLSESAISRWKSVIQHQPKALLKIIVRDNESMKLVKKLLKIHSLKIDVKTVLKMSGD